MALQKGPVFQKASEAVSDLNKSLDNKVHIWIVDFRSQTEQVNDLEELLSADELRRANIYATRHLRDSFVIARGYLRRVLSTWVHIDAKEIKFKYSPFGKPEIDDPRGNLVQFNLSHSDNYFAIAVSNYFPVGIDIEFCCSEMEVYNVAQHIMTSNEFSCFSSLKNEFQRKQFFNIWTAKESLVKAIGRGLSVNLQDIEVDYSKGTFIFKAEEQGISPKNWYFSHYEFDYNYSLTISSPVSNLEIFFHSKLS